MSARLAFKDYHGMSNREGAHCQTWTKKRVAETHWETHHSGKKKSKIIPNLHLKFVYDLPLAEPINVKESVSPNLPVSWPAITANCQYT